MGMSVLQGSRMSEPHPQLTSGSREVLQHDAMYHIPCRAYSALRHEAMRRVMIGAG